MLTVRQSVEDSTGRLTIGPTKTYATRTINLPTALVADLTRLEADGLVFANRAGGYLRYGNWRRDCWNPAVKRSGVPAHTIYGRPAQACL
jgi:hypothetical protein